MEELHDEVCEDGVPKECNRARTCKVSLRFTTVQAQAGKHSGFLEKIAVHQKGTSQEYPENFTCHNNIWVSTQK